MLNGKDLGAAIKSAIELKLASGAARSQAEIARHFDVKPPSIHDWIKKGSISKDKLPELWRYFSDVVGPSHWGLKAWPDMGTSSGSVSSQGDRWPFPSIPEGEVRALPESHLRALEGAMALAIAQLKLGIRVAAPQRDIRRIGTLAPSMDSVADAFPQAPVEPAPWEPGGTTTKQLERHELMRREAVAANEVAGNVAPGEPHPAADKFERVPELADVRLAAGDGIENHSEDQTGVIQFRKSFLRSVGADGGRGIVVYAKGDSMKGLINDGWMMLLVPQQGLTLNDLLPDAVYAINYDGKMIVKQIARDSPTQRWVAKSYNPAYPDLPLDESVSVRLLGQVVWAGGRLTT